MSTQHTPGELILVDSIDDDGNPITEFAGQRKCIHAVGQPMIEEPIGIVYDGSKSANAIRLTTCWNCHDELVEALRPMLNGTHWITSDQIAAARAAIKKATTP